MARCVRAFVAALADTSGEQRAQLFVRDFVLARLAAVDLNSAWLIEVSECSRHQPVTTEQAGTGVGNRLIPQSAGLWVGI